MIQRATIIMICILFLSAVHAQPDLKPGIKPNSPWYFIDEFFDNFQEAESLANEKAAEIIEMAEHNHPKGLQKAIEKYEKALEKRKSEAQNNQNSAEEVARQISKHLAVLAEVRYKVPEDAKGSIDYAINKSSKGRQDAIESLKRFNTRRAQMVQDETQEDILSHIPEHAQEKLKRQMGLKFQTHMDALNRSIECGLLPETVEIPYETNLTERTLFSPSEAQALVAEVEEIYPELAKEITDYLNDQYGREKEYWNNHDGCPIPDNETKESEPRGKNRGLEKNKGEPDDTDPKAEEVKDKADNETDQTDDNLTDDGTDDKKEDKKNQGKSNDPSDDLEDLGNA